MEKLMLVDAHCHLTGPDLDRTAQDALLERARQAGVGALVVVATDREDVPRVLELLDRHADLAASLGLHPHEARRWDAATAEALARHLAGPGVRFLGETGLDFHYDFSSPMEQEAAFRAQIALARQARKPLMIHTRSAAARTLAILREEGAREVGGIIHCFSEDLDFARQALDLGFHLSFSGIVTFPRKAEEIRRVAAWVPGDRLHVETDSPYLAPVPHRGRRNEPAYVRHVAECVAALRGEDPLDLAERAARNLEALCGWPPSC